MKDVDNLASSVGSVKLVARGDVKRLRPGDCFEFQGMAQSHIVKWSPVGRPVVPKTE